MTQADTPGVEVERATYVTVKRAAELLATSPWSIAELIERGDLTSHLLEVVSLGSLLDYTRRRSRGTKV